MKCAIVATLVVVVSLSAHADPAPADALAARQPKLRLHGEKGDELAAASNDRVYSIEQFLDTGRTSIRRVVASN